MSIVLTTDSKELLVNKKYVNPTGSIICYAGHSAPDGWLICDGSQVLKSIYSDLYNIIGNTYGNASDLNYFVLPNLKEKVPVGKSNVTNFNLGNTGGSKTVTLSVNQLPSHNHTGTTVSDGSHTHTGTSDSAGTHNHSASDSGHTHTYADAYFAENLGQGGNNNYGTSGGTDSDNNFIYRSGPVTNIGYANITVNSNGDHTHTFTTGSHNGHTHTFTTDSTGSGNAINVVNPYIALNYLIKY